MIIEVTIAFTFRAVSHDVTTTIENYRLFEVEKELIIIKNLSNLN